jgi:hypothetical protein
MKLTNALILPVLALGMLAASAPASTAKMIAEPVAVLQGLDKITARVSRFDAAVGEPVRFSTLSIVVRDCQRSAPEDQPENAAFLEIYEDRPGEERARLFGGWMFSSSPALSALEHPVYDVNLLACTSASGASSDATPPPDANAATPKPSGNARGNTAR